MFDGNHLISESQNPEVKKYTTHYVTSDIFFLGGDKCQKGYPSSRRYW